MTVSAILGKMLAEWRASLDKAILAVGATRPVPAPAAAATALSVGGAAAAAPRPRASKLSDDDVRRAVADNLNDKQIAAKFGVSDGLVWQRRRKLRLRSGYQPQPQTPKAPKTPRTLPPWPHAERFRDLWNAGATRKQIATETQTAIFKVSGRAAALGLPSRGSGWKPPGFRGFRGGSVAPIAVAAADPAAERAKIAAHIAAKGVTKCPPSAVAASSAVLPPTSAPAIRQHREQIAKRADEAAKKRGANPVSRARAANYAVG